MAKVETGSLTYKLVAVFLALILWFNAWDQQNPVIEEVFNISLEVRNLPSQLVAVEGPGNIQIRVEGRKNVMEEITARDFQAYVDMNGAKMGEHEVGVEVSAPPGVYVVSVAPSKVILSVDERAQVQLPVKVEIEGSPAVGYKNLSPTVEPSEVIVSGPKSILKRVESAHVVVDIGGANENMVRILPVVVRGESIDDKYQIMVSPSTAKVFVPVVREGLEKRVPVEVILTGAPAEGYTVERVVVQPREIRIFGPGDVLKNISRLSTYPVNVGGKDSGFTTSAGIAVPVLVDAETVAVDVFVDIRKK
ncbi:MAG: hypothetical protein GX088_02425 [Clostridia bacterium]|nr:hypothetical protein [Clostridia bacterium]